MGRAWRKAELTLSMGLPPIWRKYKPRFELQRCRLFHFTCIVPTESLQIPACVPIFARLSKRVFVC